MLRTVVLVGLMKVCSKIVEMQFAALDPAKWNSTANSDKKCNYLVDDIDANQLLISTTAWIFSARYILPLLGGLLASACVSYITVMQVGGLVMLMAAVLLFVSVYFDLICHTASMNFTTWTLLPLFFGLIQPNILYGMFLCRWQDRHDTLVSTLYYLASDAGEFIGYLIPQFVCGHLPWSTCTIVFVALSALFMLLSFLLPHELVQHEFILPRRKSLVLYSQIFSALIPFLISVVDARSVMYAAEMKFYFNETGHVDSWMSSWLSPAWLKVMTQIVIAPIFILATVAYPHRLPVHPRMQIGILLRCSVALALMLFTLPVSWKDSISSAALPVFSMASVLDGVAEVFVMVAAYDLVQQVSPRSAKAFVIGMMYTVWGFSNIVSHLALFLQPVEDTSRPEIFYLFHLVTLVLLIFCLLYQQFWVKRLVRNLVVELQTMDSEELLEELQDTE